jgi:sugar fermentation stimulation protein A
MRFNQTLSRGTLIRRYKRFLAEVELPTGEILTIHCPNSGAMLTCSAPGSPAYFSRSDNQRRRYPHTLEMVHNGVTWIGVNTMRTNALVAEALENGVIDELGHFDSMMREIKTSPGTRLDLMLSSEKIRTYIEVKNCTLVRDGRALFPDAVTSRGTKHLAELMRLRKEGNEAAVIFLIQRDDAQSFAPAADIDPTYADSLAAATAAGVRIIAYTARVTPEEITVQAAVPVIIAL